MNPMQASSGAFLEASGLATTEVVIFKTNQITTLASAWAIADRTAAATSNLTCVFYNRGTAGAGTTILGTAGGSGSVWGATTPVSVTLTNNTNIAADSYITAAITRIAASTASAWNITAGIEFLQGRPATAN